MSFIPDTIADAIGPRTRRILILATPVVGGMISQNVFNLVDIAMVGTLGDAALAGVGAASFATFMAIAFIMGFSSGVQAMVARRKGEGKSAELAFPLNGALGVVVTIAVPWSILLFYAAPVLFPLVNDDPLVVGHAVPYLQARLTAVLALGCNFCFRGFWNGIDRPSLYMRTLVVMHTVNIALNYVLIFGHFGAPALGAQGAGIASAISTHVGLAYYVFLGIRHARKHGFLRGRPPRGTIGTILRLSIPTGIQQLLFSSGYTVLYWILAQVGRAESAAANVLINVMLVAILPSIAFGIAATTLVGQALGRRDPDDARRWGWDVVRVAMGILLLASLPMLLVPGAILGVFIHEPGTLALAKLPLRIFAVGLVFDAAGLVLQNALLGAGASRTAMIVIVACQWGLFLPAAYVAGPILGYGLVGIWTVQVLYRLVQAGIFASIWQWGNWATVRV